MKSTCREQECAARLVYSTPGTELAVRIEDRFLERVLALPEKAGGPALEVVIPTHSADDDPMTTYK